MSSNEKLLQFSCLFSSDVVVLRNATEIYLICSIGGDWTGKWRKLSILPVILGSRCTILSEVAILLSWRQYCFNCILRLSSGGVFWMNNEWWYLFSWAFLTQILCNYWSVFKNMLTKSYLYTHIARCFLPMTVFRHSSKNNWDSVIFHRLCLFCASLQKGAVKSYLR